MTTDFLHVRAEPMVGIGGEEGVDKLLRLRTGVHIG